jgi:hypothetical protein
MDIQVEIGGKTYRGSSSVERGMITVSRLHGRKRTQLGQMPEKALASMLFRELIREGKA